ncbi:Uncharacterized protein QTN25_009456 [Entamoeba marina]
MEPNNIANTFYNESSQISDLIEKLVFRVLEDPKQIIDENEHEKIVDCCVHLIRMGTEMANSEYNNYPTIMSSFVQSVEQINEGLTSLTLSNDCFVISNSLRRLCTDCVALTMIATVAPYLRLIHEKENFESVCSSVSEMIGMVGDLKDLTNEQIDLVTMEKNVLEQTTLNAIQTINNAITNKQDIFPLLSSIKENVERIIDVIGGIQKEMENNLRVIIDKDVGFNEQYNKVMNEKYPYMDALKQKNQKQQKVTEDVLTKDDKKMLNVMMMVLMKL